MADHTESYTLPYTTLFRSPGVLAQSCIDPDRYSQQQREQSGDERQLERRRQPLDDQLRDRLDLAQGRSEEHTSELQSLAYLVCRLLLEKKNSANSSRRAL